MLLEEALMLPATGVVIPEEEPDGCCSFDIDGDRRTAPDVCGHGYVPLTHSGIKRIRLITSYLITRPDNVRC